MKPPWRPSRSTRILLLLGCVALALPLLAHMLIGLHSRFIADDFCILGEMRSKGFIGSQLAWYSGITGRFSMFFFADLVELLGTGVAPYQTSVILVLMLSALVFAIRRGLKLIDQDEPLLAIIPAAIILIVVFDGTPDVYQSLYWHSGSLLYAVPLILITILAGLLLGTFQEDQDRKLPWKKTTTIALIAFVTGGFSETIVTVQTAAVLSLLAAMLILKKTSTHKRLRTMLIAILVGSLVAMTLIIMAPGNAIRKSLVPASPPMWSVVLWSARNGLAYAAKAFLRAPLGSLVAILVPMAFGWQLSTGSAPDRGNREPDLQTYKRLLISVPMLCYLLLVATVAPSQYAIDAYPTPRVLVTAQYILVCSLAVFGFLSGVMLGLIVPSPSHAKPRSRLTVTAVILVALSALSAQATARVLPRLPQVTEFSQMWDQRDRDIKRALETGATEVTANSLPHVGGLAELNYEADYWVNKCMASAYGLETIFGR